MRHENTGNAYFDLEFNMVMAACTAHTSMQAPEFRTMLCGTSCVC